MATKVTLLSILTFLIAVPILVLAYSSGPPAERTGAPGEQTCWNGCHDSFPLNSGNGAFSITGPQEFQPGQTYQFTVQISDPGQSRWGFEFTPLDVGSLNITDPVNTQSQLFNGKLYVMHTTAGTFAGTPDGPVSWSFEWSAPTNPPDSVTFYAAGNGANNDGSNSNDYIYTASFTSRLRVVGIESEPFADAWPELLHLRNYPNPFNASTTITYELSSPGYVTLDIYTLNGQRLASLVDGYQQAGQWSVTWEAPDVASGIYFYRLTVDNISATRKMVLVK